MSPESLSQLSADYYLLHSLDHTNNIQKIKLVVHKNEIMVQSLGTLEFIRETRRCRREKSSYKSLWILVKYGIISTPGTLGGFDMEAKMKKIYFCVIFLCHFFVSFFCHL